MANVIEIVIKQTSSGNAVTTVTKELGGLDKAAGNSSGVMSKLTSVLGGLGKVALGVGVGGILALGAGLAKTISTGLGFNNAMEQAAARINAFTKDAGLTADILKTVQERAAKTPFAFEEMANSAAALMPTMRASGESLEFLLEKAEILAASNPLEGLEGASFALKEAVSGDFTSIIERFNLSRSTLNALKEQGVPAMEAVGIAMAELGLDTDLVTALAETAEGRWSTFKDTLTTLAGTVTQPIFDTFSQSLGDINAWLVQIGPQLQAFATALANDVANGIVKIQGLISAFQSGGAGGLLEALGFSPEALAFINTSIAYIIEQFTQLSAVLAPSLASLQESLARLGLTFGEAGVNSQSLTAFLLTQAEFILGTVIPAWVQWIGFLAGAAAATFSAWVTYIQTAYAAWQTFSGFIQSDVVPALLKINDGITVAVGYLKSFGEGISVAFEVLEAFGNLVAAVVNKSLQAMAGLFQNVLLPALKKVGDFLNAILFPVFQSIGETTSEEVSPALKDLGEEILPMLQTGLDYVNEAVKRTISFFNSLASTVTGISLPDWIQMHSPPPLATALNLVADGADAASSAISGMMNSLAGSKWSEIRGQVFDLVDDMQDEGHYAAMGYGQSTGHAIKQAFVRAFNQSFEGIMAGTISAAQLEAITKREAGAYAERVSGNFDAIVRRAREAGRGLLAQMQQDLMDALPGMASGLSGIAGSFADMIQDAMGTKGEVSKALTKIGESSSKLASNNVELTDTLSDQGQKMAILQAEMAELTSQEELDTIAIDKKRLAIEELNEAMDKNRQKIIENNTAIAQSQAERDKLTQNVNLAGEIELLQAFLAGNEDLFKFTLADHLTGVDHVMMDRIQAQSQLNLLMREQAQQEALITQQKEAQQKLSFLQAQVDLIKQGKELGINFSDSIRFGIGASAQDMLAATNELIGAMLNQIDTTLQIGSPSKVVFKKFRDQIGGAAVMGLEAIRPMLSNVTSAMLDPLTGGSVTNSRTTNNYFNQTVNTRAESSTVIGDFRSLQLMAGP